MNYSWFIEMPERFKTKDLCEKVAQEEIDMFEYVSDELKMQEMCETVVEIEPRFFDFVPRQFRTQAMYESVIEENTFFLMPFQMSSRPKKYAKKL